MKILYGVQGTGNGHINRSRELISLLRKRHAVHVLLSGRDADKFFDIDDLKPYSMYKGLTFKTKNGEVDYVETAKHLKLSKFYKDIEEYKEDHDLVITDFEPITARIAKKKQIPSIGIAHQYCARYDLPSTKDMVSESIVKMFAPADIELGTHWWHFDGNIVPPILPNSIAEGAEAGDKVIVYLPWEDKDKIIKCLNKLDEEFIVFHPVKQRHQYGNVVVHPLSRQDFLKELKRSKGVIGNAGFQLASEAIALGKKLFVIPVRKQPEQLSNAEILRELNLGMSEASLRSTGLLKYWLQMPNREGMFIKDVPQTIADWITAGEWSTQELLERVWNNT
ncbi:MAG: hypothetical protein LC687_00760 [Actinobacteria bacterium]|nr:hypothetical protein [Actinomycetota bacterium]